MCFWWGRGYGYSLRDGLGDFGKRSGRTWRFFDAIMGMMVMLGCGCGIVFAVPCDSVIPLRKLAGDVGVTAQDWGRERPVLKVNCSLILNWTHNECNEEIKQKTSTQIHLVICQLLFPQNEPIMSLFWHMLVITNNSEFPVGSPGAAHSLLMHRWPVWIMGLLRDRGGAGILSALLKRGCEGGGPVSTQLLSHSLPTSTL